MAQDRLVFINIAWMSFYNGPDNDKAEGNFGFLKTNEIAHESWNFQEINGEIFGYVPRSARIKISRIGAKGSDESLQGVTVVWISRNPRTKKTVIVGWYRDATIHKDAEHWNLERSGGTWVGCQIKALQENATLLKTDARLYIIPTEKVKGNLGQSPVWYGKDEVFNDSVLDYIGRGGRLGGSDGKSPRQSDPELRQKVEQAAVRHAIAYYQSHSGGARSVKSVEKDGVGWDLEATGADGETLKIEVKGLSGRDLIVELTPNEYSKMLSHENRNQYIVYIVSEALDSNAKAHIFRHDAIRSVSRSLIWASDTGDVLRIDERIAARLSVAQ